MAQWYGIDEIGDLTKTSNTTLDLSQSLLRIGGQAYLTDTLTLDTGVSGVSGIDTGSIASNSTYYIYIVLNLGVPALIGSLSQFAPAGYSVYRKIGAFSTDGSAEVTGSSVKDQGKVGDVIHSMLTEEQFIAENGAGWVLADGRDVTGSKYATVTGNTTVPDMRGQFLRGKNNSRNDGNEDPGGERTLGDQQEDRMQGHRHQLQYQNVTTGGSGFGMLINPSAGSNGLTRTTGVGSIIGDGGYGTPRVDSETRPKNVTVNIFIKIEDIAV